MALSRRASSSFSCEGVSLFGVRIWHHSEEPAGQHPCDRFFLAQDLQSGITSAGLLLYFGFLEHRAGRSLGKVAFRLRVQADGGGQPSLGAAFGRSVTKAFPPLAGLEWLVALVSGSPLRLTETLSHTHVVRQP